jgi:hypothetical protein
MKIAIASASLAVIGAASVTAQYAPGLSPQQTAKPWSVSASLRGFYDDNYTTTPVSSESYGVEVSPSLSYNIALDTTYIGLGYQYRARYFEAPSRTDQSHIVNGKVSHAISERWKLDVENSFAVAQEPEIIEGAGAISTLRRIEGDNIRNRASASLSGQLTDVLDTRLSYQNLILDYELEDGDLVGSPAAPIPSSSLSSLLDRMENTVSLDILWKWQPQTAVVLGYQYRDVQYTSDGSIGAIALGGIAPASSRDNTGHYVYTGLDQNFSQTLKGQVRLGARFNEWDSTDTTSPYARANLNYNYSPGSVAQIGVVHDRNSTDVSLLSAGAPTLDQISTIIHGSVSHRITGKLTVSVIGQLQFSKFEGGAVDGLRDDVYVLGLNVNYEINKFIAAEAGYNYDELSSDLNNRGFDRNRVYIGLRASY